MLNVNQKLNFFSDSGHGWLEMPYAVFKELNVKASQFSYYSEKKKMLYLEEDCDAPRAMKALEKKGIKPQMQYINENGFSKIRNYSKVWF